MPPTEHTFLSMQDITAVSRFLVDAKWCIEGLRSAERREGKECVVRVDLGGRRIIKYKISNLLAVRATRNHRLRYGRHSRVIADTSAAHDLLITTHQP